MFILNFKFIFSPIIYYSKKDGGSNWVPLTFSLMKNILHLVFKKKYLVIKDFKGLYGETHKKCWLVFNENISITKMYKDLNILGDFNIRGEILILNHTPDMDNFKILGISKLRIAQIFDILRFLKLANSYSEMVELSKYIYLIGFDWDKIYKNTSSFGIITSDPASPISRCLFLDKKNNPENSVGIIMTHLSNNPIEWHQISKFTKLYAYYLFRDAEKIFNVSILGSEMQLCNTKNSTLDYKTLFFLQWYSEQLFDSLYHYWRWNISTAILVTRHGGMVRLHPSMSFMSKFCWKILGIYFVHIPSLSFEEACSSSRFAISHSSGSNKLFSHLTHRRTRYLKNIYEK